MISDRLIITEYLIYIVLQNLLHNCLLLCPEMNHRRILHNHTLTTPVNTGILMMTVRVEITWENGISKKCLN